MNKADFDRHLEWLFRKRERADKPQNTVDIEALCRSGIGFYFYDHDTIMFSSSGLKKARELGIVKTI